MKERGSKTLKMQSGTVKLFGFDVPVQQPTVGEMAEWEEMAQFTEAMGAQPVAARNELRLAAMLIRRRCKTEVKPADLEDKPFEEKDLESLEVLLRPFVALQMKRLTLMTAQNKQALQVLEKAAPKTNAPNAPKA